jgi:tetratricopeptide (TPR) repeat protein
MKNRIRFRATAIVLIGLGCAAVSWSAQSVDRVDAIWRVANDRIEQQENIWFDEGDFPSDIQLLKVQAELFPADYEIWTNLGWMEENVEQWDAALATYIRYRRDNPMEPDAALPEATYLFLKKIYAKVPPLLEPAISKKCHPNNFRILASSYEKLKMYADSIRVWKLYLERDPTDGAAKHNLDRVEKKLATGT